MAVGLCKPQYLDLKSGVLLQPVLILPGRPRYSTNPASVAKHTSRWFFMLPSITRVSPQPLALQRCPILIHIYNRVNVCMENLFTFNKKIISTLIAHCSVVAKIIHCPALTAK